MSQGWALRALRWSLQAAKARLIPAERQKVAVVENGERLFFCRQLPQPFSPWLGSAPELGPGNGSQAPAQPCLSLQAKWAQRHGHCWSSCGEKPSSSTSQVNARSRCCVQDCSTDSVPGHGSPCC